MKIINDILYTDGGCDAQRLDIYLPECESFDTFVYFHGGGIVAGDKASKSEMPAISECMTSHGIAFVSANYRMYPDAKHPDFIEDAASAVAWVKNNIARYGGNGRIFVGGSSAGGYISMMLQYDEHYLADHGIAASEINGYIHDAGQPTTHFNVLRERGLPRSRVIIDEAAPIYHIGLAKEYSPQLILVADNDLANRYEQTMLTVGTIKHCGYDMSRVELRVMENCTHTSYTASRDESGESVFGKIVCEFIKCV